jgi:hypothetical protein
MDAAEHHQKELEQREWEETRHKMLTPLYCDKIAQSIKRALNAHDPDGVLAGCGSVKLDVAKDGTMASTKKTLYAIDMVGRTYKITVEAI